MPSAKQGFSARSLFSGVRLLIKLLPAIFTLILLLLTLGQLAVNLMPSNPVYLAGAGPPVDMTWQADAGGGPTRDAASGSVPGNTAAFTLTLMPQSFDPSKRTFGATASLSPPTGFVSGLRVRHPGVDYPQPLTPADDNLIVMVIIDSGHYRVSSPVTVEQLRDKRAFTSIPLDGIPLQASPQQYPSDQYSLSIQAAISAVPPLEASSELVNVAVEPSLSLADKKVLLHPSGGNGQFLSLSIERDTPTQVYVYAVTLAPVALIVVLAQLMLRRRRTAEGRPLDLIVAMAAAVLTLLPLRAVLVPKELDGVAITRVDLLLALQLLFLIMLATLAFASAPDSDSFGGGARLLTKHLP